MSNLPYVGFDYEESNPPPHPDNYWHIYTCVEPSGVDCTITICAPDNEVMFAAISELTEQINAVIATALRERETPTNTETPHG